ncbi:hypothetical protein BGP_3592 [Beggiatoa sp. PS]|nr:hypothetical protein BGP_3592 [Beggiatoa sp. PS]
MREIIYFTHIRGILCWSSKRSFVFGTKLCFGFHTFYRISIQNWKFAKLCCKLHRNLQISSFLFIHFTD